jgi:membrane protease YdiL (CAAX protease family)
MAVEPVARPLGFGTEFGAIILTAATNVAVNRMLPGSAYVPASLGSAGLLTWFARRGGAGWSDMGMAPSNIGRGLCLGLLVSVPVAAVVSLGITLPPARRSFIDERVRHTDRREILYETLVRIPFGTALAEEILFRGALSGTFRLRRCRLASEVMAVRCSGCGTSSPRSIDSAETRSGGGCRGAPGSWQRLSVGLGL